MSKRRSGSGKGLRGQPILVLGLLFMAWGAFRVVTWASPLPEGYGDVLPLANGVASEELAPSAGRQHNPAVPSAPAGRPAEPRAPTIQPVLPLPDGGWNDPANLGKLEAGQGEPSARPVAANGAPYPPMRMAAGHTLLAAAGFAHMEIPPELAAFYRRALGDASTPEPAAPDSLVTAARLPDAAPAPLAMAGRSGDARSRWSADGWLLWRDDTTTPFTSGRPSYGRSQMGAVVRYELAPKSGMRPQAYLRGTAVLQGASEQEVAAGLSARPLARMPIRIAAEMRISERAQGSEVRPAAYAVTELAPQKLPGGLQAEAYLQAGYVGGDFATGFVDGQLRVDRSLASAGDFDLRAGAAAWGGAQEDGERLDVGPSASVTFRLGDTRGRVAADYRFRVAGDAEPASGPALTLSAGF